LHRLESYDIWTMCESFGWRFLPHAGGLLDQPQWLVEDLMTLTWVSGLVEQELKGEE